MSETQQVVENAQRTAEALANGSLEALKFFLEWLQTNSENREMMAMFNEITQNGTVMPLTKTFPASQLALYQAVEKKINEYNNGKEFQDKIKFVMQKGKDGSFSIWTNDDGIKAIENFQKMIGMEMGGYYAMVSTEDFMHIAKGQNVTTLKNVPLNVVDLLSKKTYTAGNEFSFTTEFNENGTCDIAILSSKFMDGSLRNSKEDLFSNLVRANVALRDSEDNKDLYHNKGEELKYERELEQKALRFPEKNENGEKMYIVSATNGGQFIEVNENGYTIYKTHKDINNIEATVSKKMLWDKTNPLSFRSSLYAEMSKMKDPMEMSADIAKTLNSGMESAKTQEQIQKGVMNACLTHCENGQVIKFASEMKMGRPLLDKDNDSLNRKEWNDKTAKAFADEYSKHRITKESEAFAASYATNAKDVFEKKLNNIYHNPARNDKGYEVKLTDKTFEIYEENLKRALVNKQCIVLTPEEKDKIAKRVLEDTLKDSKIISNNVETPVYNFIKDKDFEKFETSLSSTEKDRENLKIPKDKLVSELEDFTTVIKKDFEDKNMSKYSKEWDALLQKKDKKGFKYDVDWEHIKTSTAIVVADYDFQSCIVEKEADLDIGNGKDEEELVNDLTSDEIADYRQNDEALQESLASLNVDVDLTDDEEEIDMDEKDL